MNNIYKVIWSKAKNCYVVVSEIARSHTKSASGSEKIGGVTRRSLLASLMALSLLCGGLGVAEATVHVNEGTGVIHEVYTTVETYSRELADAKLDLKADKTDVAKNTADIATNKGNITKLENDKLDKALASETYATKDALNDLKTVVNGKADATDVNNKLANKADTTALEAKADRTYVDQKFTEAGTNVDNKLEDYYNKAEVDGKITAEENARNNAITNAIGQERNDRTTAIDTAINREATARNQAINTAIEQEKTNRNAAILTAKTELEGKITAEETARTAKDVELEGKITQNSQDIETLDKSSVKYDNPVAKDTITLAGAGGTTITRLKDAALNDSSTDAVTGRQLNKTNEDLVAEVTARTNKDTELEEKITKNSGDITDLNAKDIELAGKIQTNADNIQNNKKDITTIKQRTAGIDRIDATKETTIEGNVTVDNLGNVTAEGKLKGAGVEAGAVNAGSLIVTDASNLKGDVTMDKTLSVTGDTSLGALNVTGESSLKNTQVNGTLTTTGKATFKEAVDMDKGLTVTSGDTTLQNTDVKGALNVTGESSLKDTQVNGTLTTTGKATFKEAVDMDKGLTVTSGDTTLQNTDVKGALNVTGESNLKNTTVDGTLSVNKETTLNDKLTANGEATFGNDVTVKGTTNLKGTTVDGDLKVTGTITTDKMVFGETPNNYTEIDHGKVTSKNLVVNGAGETISSSSTFDVEKNEVGFTNTATGDHSYHKQTADGIKGYVTDKDGNKTYTKVTATENSFQVQDKDGKNKNHQVNTKDSSVTEITNAAGATTKTEQTATDIKNTAKDGTITNEAKDIVNTATTMKTTVTGKATESYGELETTVDGQATENFNNGLNTTVTGTEKHTVNGKQINTVTEGQENIISGGQTNTITGGQINNITGDQTTTITGNKTETVEGKVTENFKNGQETNVTGDQVIKVSGTQTTTATDINRNASSGMIDTIDNAYGTNTETKEAGKTTTDVSIKGTGEKGQYIRGASESRDYLIKGTLKNSETKTAEATSTEITDGTSTASTKQDAKNLAGSVTNGTETGVSGIHANDNSVSIDSIVTDGNKYSVINQKKGSIQSTVVDGTNSTVILQDTDNVTIASANGTVAIGGKYIVNNASESITNKAKTMDTIVTGKATESYGELETTVNGQATENYKGGLKTDITGEEIHTVTGNQTNKVTGKQTNTVEGGQENIISGGQINNITGDQTTIISGTQTTTATDINRNASSGMIDTIDNAYGTNTETKEAGKTTTDVSIKGTGEKGQYIRGANESRDYLIKGTLKNSETKTVEKTSTEITDGTNKASTRQDAKNLAGSVTNGTETGVSGIHANDDGSVSIDSGVTDGTNTSVQNQTASQIAAAVKDGAGNENASVATATTSANTIKNGTKTNTVISTVDGTSFVNSEAAAPVTGGSGAGTAVNTTIKGNTITTGKVTMDYADVMKDLGVHGNAKVDKNLEVGGTLDVTQKATFHDDVDITKNLSVGGNATITGDVTAKSYKVDGKTYISAAGINANDQKITNVADGSISEGSKDAVNGGQLYTVKNDLEGKVNKVGANAAAMANLHPMEFDPDSKWNIAAAIGNYGSETAAALGAFYRPNDDVMVNLSTAFGTGENMVGGGVSVRLGKGGNKLSREENNALKDQVNDLTARMDALLSVLNPNMSKDFPDVPENHWAYEAVSRLAGNDIVQGYPDGEFHGERTMTRYEMAEIIYNALSRGAEAEKELVEEFKPELQAMAASEKATAEKAEG